MKKLIFIISILFPVKTRKYGKKTYWRKKNFISSLKQTHGYNIGHEDVKKGMDNNPFMDKDKWMGYEEAQYDNYSF